MRYADHMFKQSISEHSADKHIKSCLLDIDDMFSLSISEHGADCDKQSRVYGIIDLQQHAISVSSPKQHVKSSLYDSHNM